jgi:hypothetical protein
MHFLRPIPASSLAGLLSLAGCYTSTHTTTDDAGASDDAVSRREDALAPDAFVAPLRACADAPLLVLDGTEPVSVDEAVVPGDASCWPGERRHVLRRIVIPPLTGVEVVTRSADAPFTHFHEQCVPGAEDRCVRFGPWDIPGGLSERTTYYGNASTSARTLVVSFGWVGDAVSPFTVTTRSSPVGPQGACDGAATLEPDVLRAADGTRGGTYESWHCWYLPESHFYDVTLPPRHVALPLEGSQSLRATGGCECAPLASADPLVNLGDAPTTLHLEAVPSRPIGVRLVPLPDVAVCDGAELLPIDGVARPLAAFPRRRAAVRAGGHRLRARDDREPRRRAAWSASRGRLRRACRGAAHRNALRRSPLTTRERAGRPPIRRRPARPSCAGAGG